MHTLPATDNQKAAIEKGRTKLKKTDPLPANLSRAEASPYLTKLARERPRERWQEDKLAKMKIPESIWPTFFYETNDLIKNKSDAAPATPAKRARTD